MKIAKHGSYLRDLICGLDMEVPIIDGRYVKGVNFDNAATTPAFQSVMNEVINFTPQYSSIHRGMGYKSQLSSNLYEQSRLIIANFVKADLYHKSIIFVNNTTHGINKLSYSLLNEFKDGVILSTHMEHHSNDLPWRGKYKVDYVTIDEEGNLSLEDLEAKLIKHNGKVRLVTVTGASNVTGIVNPIHKIATLAHQYNAKILVDGAQLVPHAQVDMKPVDSPEHIDYLVFSSHKMYAPFGVGVLIGWRDTFEKGNPDYVGGGTVDVVTEDFVRWSEAPFREEPGTPNVIGVVALINAIKTLNSVDLNYIHNLEKNLTNYAQDSLKNLPDVTIYGHQEFKDNRVAIIPFNIEGIHHETISKILSYEAGISVRSGCFCAHPYVQKLLDLTNEDIQNHINNHISKLPGMVRLSFGLYNTIEEIDFLTKILYKIIKNKAHYIEKYST